MGGGVIFGPKPHLVSKKINKKEKRLAILSALYLKKNQWSLINENLLSDFKTYKTKEIVQMLSTLNIPSTERILIVLTKSNPQFWESASNLKNVVITTAQCLNIKELLHANHIIMSQDSLNIINSNYKKNYE